ncbi:hypothetical protein Tco_1354244 [Tanacetum coccineum]
MSWFLRCSWCGGPFNGGNCRCCNNVSFGDEFFRNPDPISCDETPDFSYPPPQPQTYSCELCGNDSHYGYDCPPRVPLESTISLNQIISQLPPSISITTSLPVLPTMEPEDSLIVRNENLSTIPEKEPDEVIKSSVEDLVLIPSESEDTSDNDSECDLPFCDDSSPVDILGEYISSDINPLYNKVLEDIKSKDSYVSNLDESALLVTPLSDANEDECFDPRGDIDEIDADVSTDIEDGYHDSEGDVIYLECLLTNDTTHNIPPEVFLDHDPRSLKDELDNDDLKSMVKVFDLGIHEKIISLTYVRLPFEDRHYLSLTFVIKIFLPFLTYPVNSLLLLSFGSEDTIFDLGISAYSFYSLEPVAYESPMMIFPFFCFCPKNKGIRDEINLDYEDTRARGFVHRSLELQSLA